MICYRSHLFLEAEKSIDLMVHHHFTCFFRPFRINSPWTSKHIILLLQILPPNMYIYMIYIYIYTIYIYGDLMCMSNVFQYVPQLSFLTSFCRRLTFSTRTVPMKLLGLATQEFLGTVCPEHPKKKNPNRDETKV